MSTSKTPDNDALIALLDKARKRIAALENEQGSRGGSAGPIAVVGIGCRFPGDANDPQTFWHNLAHGTDAVAAVPAQRWSVDESSSSPPVQRVGGFIQDIDVFDPAFFSIAEREAASIEPEQRLLMQTGWHALEDAGIAPSSLVGQPVGVFVGIGQSDYSNLTVASEAGQSNLSNNGYSDSDAAKRLSFALELHGPSLSVDTACSSSLVAVHHAVRSLRSGETSCALAAGVNLMLLPDKGDASMLSASGNCHAFDAQADGYVRGEGVGVVVLKRLADAEDDGNRIYAVIRGTGMMQNSGVSELPAANGVSQKEVIRDALTEAGASVDELAYIEAHATGSATGDSIELTNLSAVLEGRHQNMPVRVGSVKSSIGHLEAAAGIAGLIKLCLSMHHGSMVPQLYYEKLNPSIRINPSLITPMGKELLAWPEQYPLAGVSSFGSGGTNAHVVLERYTKNNLPDAETKAVYQPAVMELSARSEDALKRLCKTVAESLSTFDEAAHSRYAVSLSRFRERHSERFSLPCLPTNRIALLDALQHAATGDFSFGKRSNACQARPPIAFVFSGERSRYFGLGRELYAAFPVFAESLDHSAQILESCLEIPLLALLFGDDTDLQTQTRYAQPAIHALQLALVEQLQYWGVEADVVLGQDLGEYAAATTAGAMSSAESLRLVVERGRLMHASQGSLEPMLSELQLACSSIDFKPLTMPLISNLTSRQIAQGTILDADHWIAHTREPVLFDESLTRLSRDRDIVLIEIGPDLIQSDLHMSDLFDTEHSIPMLRADGDEVSDVVNALACFSAVGIDVNHDVHNVGNELLPALPAYPFSKDIYWIDTVEEIPLSSDTDEIPVLDEQITLSTPLAESVGDSTDPHSPVMVAPAPQFDKVSSGNGALEGVVAQVATDTLLLASPSQLDVLFNTLLDKSDNACQLLIELEFDASVNTTTLHDAFADIVARHTALRSRFVVPEDREPYVVVEAEVSLPWAEHDLREHDDAQSVYQYLVGELKKIPLDMTQAPLMRFVMVRISDARYALLWFVNRAIVDRQSTQILIADLFEFYNARCEQRILNLPPAPRFESYLHWLGSRDQSPALAHWDTELGDFDEPVRLTVGRDSSAESGDIATVTARLPAEHVEPLRKLAKERNIALDTVLQGAWAVLMSRYSARQDVLFAVTASARPAQLNESGSMVGLFLNAIPQRVRMDETLELWLWLEQLQRSFSNNKEHSHIGYRAIQKCSRVPSGKRLAECMLVLQGNPVEEGPESLVHHADGISQPHHLQKLLLEQREDEQTSYPLCLYVRGDDVLTTDLQYDTGRFEQADMDTMLESYAWVLEQFASAESLCNVQSVSPVMRSEIEGFSEGKVVDFSHKSGLLALFFQQVKEKADTTVLIQHDRTITYRELDDLSQQAAARLTRLGVTPGSVIGIYAEQGIDTVASMLAVLKTGALWTLLDPGASPESLLSQIKDVEPAAILVDSDVLPFDSDEVRQIRFSVLMKPSGKAVAALTPVIRPDSALLCIMPCAESDGTYKNVFTTHGTLLNRLRWMWRIQPFAVGEMCVSIAPLSAIDSMTEIFGPLLSGTPSAILDSQTVNSPERLVEALGLHRVTRITLASTLLGTVLNEAVGAHQFLPSLKKCIVTGSTVSRDLVSRFQRLLPLASLHRLHRSTEAALDITIYDTARHSGESTVAVGQPIDNVCVYVLDSELRLVPRAVVGDIYIGAPNLADGYSEVGNQDALFVRNPFGHGLLLHSRDRGWWDSDGQLRCVSAEHDQLASGPHSDIAFVAPQSEVEQMLVSAIADTLKLDSMTIGRNHHFYNVGGDSIAGLQLLANVRKQGWAISVNDFHNSQSISALAACARSVVSSEEIDGAALASLKPIPLKLYIGARVQSEFAVSAQQVDDVIRKLKKRHPRLNGFIGEGASTTDATEVAENHEHPIPRPDSGPLKQAFYAWVSDTERGAHIHIAAHPGAFDSEALRIVLMDCQALLNWTAEHADDSSSESPLHELPALHSLPALRRRSTELPGWQAFGRAPDVSQSITDPWVSHIVSAATHCSMHVWELVCAAVNVYFVHENAQSVAVSRPDYGANAQAAAQISLSCGSAEPAEALPEIKKLLREAAGESASTSQFVVSIITLDTLASRFSDVRFVARRIEPGQAFVGIVVHRDQVLVRVWCAPSEDGHSPEPDIAGFSHILEQIVAFSQKTESSGKTVDDFPLVNIDQAGLQRLEKQFPSLVELYPATAGQANTLFNSSGNNGQGVSTSLLRLELGVEIKEVLIRAALQELVDRHDALRTVFAWQGIEPQQLVVETAPLPWTFINLANGSIASDDSKALDSAIQTIVRKELATPFDLAEAPLMRVTLIRKPDGTAALIWLCHDAIVDGWSLSVMSHELSEIYQAHVTGQKVALPTAPVFEPFAQWLATRDQESARAHWSTRLDMVKPIPALPIGLEQSAESGVHAIHTISLDMPVLESLQHFGDEQSLSLASVLQGAMLIMLSRYTGEASVTLAVAVSGRPPVLPDMDCAVGAFANVLPLTMVVQNDMPLSDWLDDVQHHHEQDDKFHFVSPDRLLQDVDLPLGTRFSDCLLVLRDYPEQHSLDKGCAIAKGQSVRITVQASIYPITIVATREQAGLRIDAQYDSGRFVADDMISMTGLLEKILAQIAAGNSAVATADRLYVGSLGLHVQNLQEAEFSSGVVRPEPSRSQSVSDAFSSELEQLTLGSADMNDDISDARLLGVDPVAFEQLTGEYSVSESLTPASELLVREYWPSADLSASHPLSFEQSLIWNNYLLSRQKLNLAIDSDPIEIPTHSRDRLDDVLVAMHHEQSSLRTQFAIHEDGPRQQVSDTVSMDVARVRVPAMSQMNAMIDLHRLRLSAQAFDLSNGPLWRVCILENDSMTVLLASFCRLVFDEISLQAFYALLEERLYDSQSLSEVSGTDHHYIDYTKWQHVQYARKQWEAHLDWWSSQVLPFVAEPDSTVSSIVNHGPARFYELSLDRDLLKALNYYAQNHGSSLYVVLLTLFTQVVGRRISGNNVLVAAPVTRRNQQESDGLFGQFTRCLYFPAKLTYTSADVSTMNYVVAGAHAYGDIPRGLLELSLAEQGYDADRFDDFVFNFASDPASDTEQGRTGRLHRHVTRTVSPSRVQSEKVLLHVDVHDMGVQTKWHIRSDAAFLSAPEQLIADFEEECRNLVADKLQNRQWES